MSIRQEPDEIHPTNAARIHIKKDRTQDGRTSNSTLFYLFSTMKNALFVLGAAALVSAHTILDELYVNGVSQGLHNCLRLPSYDGEPSSPSDILHSN